MSLGVLRRDWASFVAFREGSVPLRRGEELRRFSAIFGNVPFSTCSVICDMNLSVQRVHVHGEEGEICVQVCVCVCVADEW